MTVRPNSIDAYLSAPSSEKLAALRGLDPVEVRHALAQGFDQERSWKVAQHLALLWLNKVEPYGERRDLLRADYFAHQATALSEGDPRARLARVIVYWERRLSLAVFQEASHAESELKRVEDPATRRAVCRTLSELKACALAYEGRLRDAAELIVEIRKDHGQLSLEPIMQLFLSARGESPEAELQAVRLLARFPLSRGSTTERRVVSVLRAALVALLRARSHRR